MDVVLFLKYLIFWRLGKGGEGRGFFLSLEVILLTFHRVKTILYFFCPSFILVICYWWILIIRCGGRGGRFIFFPSVLRARARCTLPSPALTHSTPPRPRVIKPASISVNLWWPLYIYTEPAALMTREWGVRVEWWEENTQSLIPPLPSLLPDT